MKALALIIFCAFAMLTHAGERYVTLWINVPTGSTNPVHSASLRLATNQTAVLVSWPQNETAFSLVTVTGGSGNSVTISRKPEMEIGRQPVAKIERHGLLPLPELTVAGPAQIELLAKSGNITFCTFRVLD